MVALAAIMVISGCSSSPNDAPDAQPHQIPGSSQPPMTTTPVAPATTATSQSPRERLAEVQERAGEGKVVDCKAFKCVALTFDDGPGDQEPALTSTLRAEHAPATFFLYGAYVSRNSQYVKLLADTPGVEIGNHTVSHQNMAKLSYAGQLAEIQNNTNRLVQLGAKKITWFRPPMGSWNQNTLAAARVAVQSTVTWNLDTLDWKNRDTAYVRARVKQYVQPGSVVLMHSIHPTSVAAVPGIIADLKASGYLLVNLTQLLGEPQPGALFELRDPNRPGD